LPGDAASFDGVTGGAGPFGCGIAGPLLGAAELDRASSARLIV
jgi:hypothetical protein